MPLILTEDQVPREDSPGWYEVPSDDPSRRIFRYDREGGGYYQRTETVAEDTLIAWNQFQSDISKGKRLGEQTKVGSIPLHVLYDPKTQIAEKMREGDKDHLKWWLNSDEARPFKTWWGKI